MDALWTVVEPLLPKRRVSKRDGRGLTTAFCTRGHDSPDRKQRGAHPRASHARKGMGVMTSDAQPATEQSRFVAGPVTILRACRASPPSGSLFSKRSHACPLFGFKQELRPKRSHSRWWASRRSPRPACRRARRSAGIRPARLWSCAAACPTVPTRHRALRSCSPASLSRGARYRGSMALDPVRSGRQLAPPSGPAARRQRKHGRAGKRTWSRAPSGRARSSRRRARALATGRTSGSTPTVRPHRWTGIST